MALAGSVRRSKSDWEELAQIDPCWAILSNPSKKFGRWRNDEFFQTGAQEIGQLMQSLAQLGYPVARHLALDFGCGIGRLTRALSSHFSNCVGVDIADEMIVRARELNKDRSNCEFFVNASERLEQFRENSFDLIYTSIVLQHVPTRAAILSYVADFLRILKPAGLLVMQVPSSIPWHQLLQPRRRLYQLLRKLGFDKSLLYEHLSLNPMRMTCVSEKAVLQFLGKSGGNVLRVQGDTMAGPGIESRTYFVTKCDL